MRTTVRLPEDLLKRAKRKAAATGTSLTALIEEGLRSVIDERPKSGKPKRFVLPVSRATGGFAPNLHAVDPAKFASAVDQSEDLERVRRIHKRK